MSQPYVDRLKRGRPASLNRRARLVPPSPTILMLGYGIGSAFTISIVGQLYASELIGLLFLPFVGWHKALQCYRSLRIIVAGYGLLLIGLVASDLNNSTAFLDSLRGWANPVAAITSTVFVTSVLRRNINAFVYFLVGSCAAMLLFGSAAYAPRYGEVDVSLAAITENANVFKVRFVPFLIPGLMLVSIFLFRLGPMYGAALYAVASVIFFSLDARSAGLTLLISATLMAMRIYKIRITASAALLASAPLLLVGQLAFATYVDYTLRENPNGHNARQLAKLENPYNPLALLLQGRSEWTVAADAIAAKPIFGHGSWAYDLDYRYSALRAERSDSLEEFWRESRYRDGVPLIPVHSVLATSWIWAGLLGFLGFLLVFCKGISLGVSAISMPGRYSAVATLMFVMLLWDALFSPIGAIRLIFPQILGFLIALSEYNWFKKNNA